MQSLPSPRSLRELYPLPAGAAKAVDAARSTVASILAGRDDRLLAIVGPCSVHDEQEALEYASFLKEQADLHAGSLFVAIRLYVEKSRTGDGWKGMARDPSMDGVSGTAEGIAAARRLIVRVAATGLPVAVELASPFLWPYWIDAVSWASVGARGVESQALREAAQALPCPCGFKNGRDGSLENALTAARVSSMPGRVILPDEDGRAQELHAKGNPRAHIILRGTDRGPNWRRAPYLAGLMRGRGLDPSIIVDASHGNSGKDPRRQAAVALGALALRKRCPAIRGIMIESYMKDGSQPFNPGAKPLPGLSLTDPCMGMEATARLLDRLH